MAPSPSFLGSIVGLGNINRQEFAEPLFQLTIAFFRPQDEVSEPFWIKRAALIRADHALAVKRRLDRRRFTGYAYHLLREGTVAG